MQVAPQRPRPERDRLYNRLEMDGIEVYLHCQLMQVGPRVSIDLAGFWRLRWLRVRGLGLVGACAY